MNNRYYIPNPRQSFPTDVTYPAPSQQAGPDLEKSRADIPSQRPEPAPKPTVRNEEPPPEKK